MHDKYLNIFKDKLEQIETLAVSDKKKEALAQEAKENILKLYQKDKEASEKREVKKEVKEEINIENKIEDEDDGINNIISKLETRTAPVIKDYDNVNKDIETDIPNDQILSPEELFDKLNINQTNEDYNDHSIDTNQVGSNTESLILNSQFVNKNPHIDTKVDTQPIKIKVNASLGNEQEFPMQDNVNIVELSEGQEASIPEASIPTPNKNNFKDNKDIKKEKSELEFNNKKLSKKEIKKQKKIEEQRIKDEKKYLKQMKDKEEKLPVFEQVLIFLIIIILVFIIVNIMKVV
ncbi:MAG: hypothetical protein ACK5HS_02210 [Mycoplasmatales bacterium]